MSPRKPWNKPVIRLMEAREIVNRAKTREELLRVRTLVERASEIIEANKDLSGSAAEIREVLGIINEAMSEGAGVNRLDRSSPSFFAADMRESTTATPVSTAGADEVVTSPSTTACRESGLSRLAGFRGHSRAAAG